MRAQSSVRFTALSGVRSSVDVQRWAMPCRPWSVRSGGGERVRDGMRGERAGLQVRRRDAAIPSESVRQVVECGAEETAVAGAAKTWRSAWNADRALRRMSYGPPTVGGPETSCQSYQDRSRPLARTESGACEGHGVKGSEIGAATWGPWSAAPRRCLPAASFAAASDAARARCTRGSAVFPGPPSGAPAWPASGRNDPAKAPVLRLKRLVGLGLTDLQTAAGRARALEPDVAHPEPTGRIGHNVPVRHRTWA